MYARALCPLWVDSWWPAWLANDENFKTFSDFFGERQKVSTNLPRIWCFCFADCSSYEITPFAQLKFVENGGNWKFCEKIALVPERPTVSLPFMRFRCRLRIGPNYKCSQYSLAQIFIVPYVSIDESIVEHSSGTSFFSVWQREEKMFWTRQNKSFRFAYNRKLIPGAYRTHYNWIPQRILPQQHCSMTEKSIVYAVLEVSFVRATRVWLLICE